MIAKVEEMNAPLIVHIKVYLEKVIQSVSLLSFRHSNTGRLFKFSGTVQFEIPLPFLHCVSEISRFQQKDRAPCTVHFPTP